MNKKCSELFAIMMPLELRTRIEAEADKRGLHASSFARSILYREMFGEKIGGLS
jgi:hypothetical protein